jgi:endonuclease YncB( thermonuclease family)
MLLAKGDKAHVTRKEYESFAEKIIEAELLAKRERLGIWSE